MMRSVSLPSALSMMTGGPRSVTRRRAADSPSSPGIMTSRITRSGRCFSMHKAHGRGVRRRLHAIAVTGEEIADQLAQIRVVVDHQYQGAVIHFRRMHACQPWEHGSVVGVCQR